MLTSKKIHYDDATFAGAQTTRTQISQHVCYTSFFTGLDQIDYGVRTLKNDIWPYDWEN